MKKDFKNIKAVFFDAGNTLIYPDYFVIQTVLADFGIKTTVARIRMAEYEALATAQNSQGSQAWKTYFGIWIKLLGGHENRIKEIYGKLWERHRQKHLWSLVDEDAVVTLSALKERGYRLGVISNSDGSIATLLRDCNLTDYFEVIVDSEVVGIRKPSPAIFEFALNKMAAKAPESLFVGDSYETDVLGAQQAGLTGILFDPLKKFTTFECVKINRLSELLDSLQGHHYSK
ncbi:MAG: HAD family hydrolase [bacterium]